MNFDPIIGETINSVFVVYGNSTERKFHFIYELIFEVGDHYLKLLALPEYDEIGLKITKSTSFRDVQKPDKVYKVSRSDKIILSELIDKPLVWVWVLCNNQGYKDGVEMELDTFKNKISIRFLVEASSIWVSKIENANRILIPE